MRKHIAGIAVLCLSAAWSELSAQTRDEKTDKEAIRAIMKEAGAAHTAGDAERWVSVFSPDAVLMPANKPEIKGREALLRMARDLFENFTSTASIKPLEVEVAGDWAFARTNISGRLTPKRGGKAIELDGKEIGIFRRQPDGTWKVARLIGNSNRPEGRWLPSRD
jgi:uncharacterized protein (TIGR02246 family)